MNKFVWAGAAGLALVAAPAMADDTGFYAGLGIGQFGIDLDDVEGSGLDFDEDDTGFRGFGGWQFTKYFAVEAGYLDGGSASATIGDIAVDGIEADLEVEASGFDVTLVGTLPIGESFYGYARAGFIAWDADLSAVVREDDGEGGVITTSESASDSGEDPAYGLGFGMDFGDNASARIEYTLYDLSDVDGEFISANFLWRFR